MRAARCFGAAKEAIFALERYYKQELDAINALDPDKRPKPAFPHPDHYISLSNTATHAFRYVSPLYNDKLIFHGKTDGEDICIKFARQYSKDAHLKCSTLGFAPALRGYQFIPGGWIMVVMDSIDDSYQELDDMPQSVKATFDAEVREKLVSLHQAGYVHGDVRATNILAKKNGARGIMLIDFDWAGVIGDVRYPMNVNRDGIDRPDGAYDGELIAAEHDMNMVDNIFA
jgi:serine/threonine protein kinase